MPPQKMLPYFGVIHSKMIEMTQVAIKLTFRKKDKNGFSAKFDHFGGYPKFGLFPIWPKMQGDSLILCRIHNFNRFTSSYMNFEADIIVEIVFFTELDYCKYTQNATANNLKFYNSLRFSPICFFFILGSLSF